MLFSSGLMNFLINENICSSKATEPWLDLPKVRSRSYADVESNFDSTEDFFVPAKEPFAKMCSRTNEFTKSKMCF